MGAAWQVAWTNVDTAAAAVVAAVGPFNTCGAPGYSCHRPFETFQLRERCHCAAPLCTDMISIHLQRPRDKYIMFEY